jgi:regulator of replication initiation timing
VLRADRAENLDQKGDIGPSSSAELVQLQARIGELESENHRLEHENAALRRRIVELEKATASAAPPADDDGLGIPDFLRRAAP